LKTDQVIVGNVEGIPVVETTFGYPEISVNVDTRGAVVVVSMVFKEKAGILKDMLGADMIVAPDTSPRSVIRDDKGQIVGVKQLVKLA